MLLNANSPTVQAMLKDTPAGVGNMPMYNGNPPSVSTPQVQPQQFNSPFPSPKDMLSNAGQAGIYAPMGFGSQPNFIGGNPNIMNGYQNPYMGYGYSGYTTPYPTNPYGMLMPMYQPPRVLTDQEIVNIETLWMAGLQVSNPMEIRDNEIKTEIEVLKGLSRSCAEINGLSEEEISERQALYDPIMPKEPTQKERKIRPLIVTIDDGNGNLRTINSDEVMAPHEDYYLNGRIASNVGRNAYIRQCYAIQCINQLYDNAPERKYDNASMYEMFNEGGLAALDRDIYLRLEQEQARSITGGLYDKSSFRRLLNSYGSNSKENSRAISRFTGRYGFMPDGRPVSPQHDPSIASSFSYNPNTGEYEITPPNFIAQRLEKARKDFYQTIDGSNDPF